MNNNDNKSLFDMYNAGTPEENNATSDIEHVNLISEKKETKNLIDINDEPNKEEKKEDSQFINRQDTKAVPDYIMKDQSKGTDDIEYLSDEALLRLYVGENYEKISKGSFSLPAFLFGIYYLFYRKMYAIAIPLIVAIAASQFLIKNQTLTLMVSFVASIIALVVSLFFKKLYMKKAKKFVAELQTTNLSNSDKKRRARSNGGVDNKVFIVIIGMVILASITTVKQTIEAVKNIHTIKATQEIVYTVPSWAESNMEVFSDDSTEGNIREIKYDHHDKLLTYKDNDSNCNFRISYTNEYKSANKNANTEITNYMSNVFNKDATFSNEEYSGFTYKHYYDQNENVHYYIHMSENLLTLFKVDIKRDDKKTCEKITKEMLDTAKEYKGE